MMKEPIKEDVPTAEQLATTITSVRGRRSAVIGAEVASGYTSGKIPTLDDDDPAGQPGAKGYNAILPITGPPAPGDKLVKIRVGETRKDQPDEYVVARIGEPASSGITGYEMLPVEYPSNGASVGVGSANQVRGYRFRLREALSLTKLYFKVATAGTAFVAKASIAIWNDAGTSMLINTGAQNADNAVVISHTFSALVLQVGFYRLCWCANETVILLSAEAISTDGNSLLNQGETRIFTAANAGSDGAMPSSLGTLSAGSFAVPYCKLLS